MMAADYYPVATAVKPGNIGYDDREGLGTKEKFRFRTDDGNFWLFKYPRPGSGEHWAEKISAEIATLIGVHCAEVQLSRCGDDLGMQSLLVVEPDGLRVHGNEVMAESIAGYDEHLRFGQREHCIRNIMNAVAGWTTRNRLDQRQVMGELVSYAILDGLIGNTDRHHENWMFYYDPERGSMRLAPSYDHGSSLGRELPDDRRIRILNENRMLGYILGGRGTKGKGRVYFAAHRRVALSPLHLAQLLCRWQPGISRPRLERLRSVPDSQFCDVIARVPPEFMSDAAKKFAYHFVMVSKSELLRRVR